MNRSQLKRELTERLSDAVTDVRERGERRLDVTLADRASIDDAVATLDALGVTHLITITGVDAGEDVDVLYHFLRYGDPSDGDLGEGVEVTLRVAVPKDDPTVGTITDRIPGAALYERELMDMLGVEVTGHPDPRKLLLPDDWEGGAPLRADGEVTES